MLVKIIHSGGICRDLEPILLYAGSPLQLYGIVHFY